ncbi:MAG: hypothetical protein AAGE83_00140 [Pseudomonadota bacterium]
MGYPLSPGGCAADCVELLGRTGAAELADRTPRARFGLKGPGALDWFEPRVPVPEVNRIAEAGGLRIARLGPREVMVLAETDDAPVRALRSDWEAAPVGHSSWREEGWSWLRLTGEAALDVAARLTACDLRAGALAPNGIAQTRFAYQNAVLLRAGDGFDILFDVAATAQVVRDVHSAMQRTEAAR